MSIVLGEQRFSLALYEYVFSEFFYAASGVPSAETLQASQPKPDGQRMEFVMLDRLMKYGELRVLILHIVSPSAAQRLLHEKIKR